MPSEKKSKICRKGEEEVEEMEEEDKGVFNPFNPKLIMQILPTIQEENNWVM